MGGVVKAIKKVVDFVVDVVDTVVDFVVDTVKEVVDFAVNVVKGAINAVLGMVEGIVTGDWTMFRDSFFSAVQTVVYAFGAVIGAVSGNAWLVAASVVALDGLHNEGQLTSHLVTTVGKIERELLGSELILENLELVTSAIVMVGSAYSGYKAFDLLAKASGISSLLESHYVQVGLGINSIADAYEQFQYAQGLYDELMREYQAWLQQVGQTAEYFNTLWDTVYSDVDILYSASAGGYLFNAAAGSDEYSVSSVSEQSMYLLGLDTKRDIDFDRNFTDPITIDHVNLNIEDTKPEILRYET